MFFGYVLFMIAKLLDIPMLVVVIFRIQHKVPTGNNFCHPRVLLKFFVIPIKLIKLRYLVLVEM